MGMSHDTLKNHYELNVYLMLEHKIQLQEIDDMYPFEREIYIMMIHNHLDKKEKALKSQQDI
jgi:hypothetical protein